MDELMKKINVYPNGTYLKVEWEHGLLILEGKIDTFFETNNGLDNDDVGYKEFYSCLIRIEKIIENSLDDYYKEGGLAEISIEFQPTLIELKDGTIIWQE